MLASPMHTSRMNKLRSDKRAQVVSCLVEGNSIRATVRMTGVAKNTVVKLLGNLGRACSKYQDETFRDLKCKRLQCDEIWSFVYAKEKNCAPEQKKNGGGDVWTWTAICADSKLIPCWFVGNRDAGCAYHFIHDLKMRLANRVQLTTDGHRAYLTAVEDAFGCEVDYAMLQKIYGTVQDKPETRYSPAACMGARKAIITGSPDHNHISTSFAERQNLTMRSRCAALLDSPMDFQRNSKTTSTHWRFILCITISAGFIKHCALRQR